MEAGSGVTRCLHKGDEDDADAAEHLFPTRTLETVSAPCPFLWQRKSLSTLRPDAGLPRPRTTAPSGAPPLLGGDTCPQEKLLGQLRIVSKFLKWVCVEVGRVLGCSLVPLKFGDRSLCKGHGPHQCEVAGEAGQFPRTSDPWGLLLLWGPESGILQGPCVGVLKPQDVRAGGHWEPPGAPATEQTGPEKADSRWD